MQYATGYFLQCPREENESDSNYLYRLSNWTQRNAACNQQAILDKCKELKYSSNQSYVPYTKGVGTATIYVIPLEYTDGAIVRALTEAREKVSTVLSPSSIVEFEVPEPKYIRIVSYLDIKSNSDKESIKINLTGYLFQHQYLSLLLKAMLPVMLLLVLLLLQKFIETD